MIIPAMPWPCLNDSSFSDAYNKTPLQNFTKWRSVFTLSTLSPISDSSYNRSYRLLVVHIPDFTLLCRVGILILIYVFCCYFNPPLFPSSAGTAHRAHHYPPASIQTRKQNPVYLLFPAPRICYERRQSSSRYRPFRHLNYYPK